MTVRQAILCKIGMNSFQAHLKFSRRSSSVRSTMGFDARCGTLASDFLRCGFDKCLSMYLIRWLFFKAFGSKESKFRNFIFSSMPLEMLAYYRGVPAGAQGLFCSSKFRSWCLRINKGVENHMFPKQKVPLTFLIVSACLRTSSLLSLETYQKNCAG